LILISVIFFSCVEKEKQEVWIQFCTINQRYDRGLVFKSDSNFFYFLSNFRGGFIKLNNFESGKYHIQGDSLLVLSNLFKRKILYKSDSVMVLFDLEGKTTDFYRRSNIVDFEIEDESFPRF